MRHYFRKMPAANVVASPGTSTFQLPLGPSYRSLILRVTSGSAVDMTEANMATNITRIVVRFNGIARIDVSGARYISLLKYYGYTIADGVLPIIFSRTYARTVLGEENLVLGTANLETLTVEVQLASGITTPTLSMDALYTPERRDSGAIIQILENTFTASASGQFEISSLPKTNGALVGMHMFSSAITGVNVLLDNVEHFDADLATVRSMVTHTGRVPQTNVQHVEPTFLDRFDDIWPLAGVQDFRLKLTMSGAGSVPILMETANIPIAPRA